MNSPQRTTQFSRIIKYIGLTLATINANSSAKTNKKLTSKISNSNYIHNVMDAEISIEYNRRPNYMPDLYNKRKLDFRKTTSMSYVIIFARKANSNKNVNYT